MLQYYMVVIYMCGRFTLTLSKAQLESFLKHRYDILTSAELKLPKYNISPTNEVISVLHDGKRHRVGQLRWGFRPKFSKLDKPLEIINAKGETIFEKPIFKESALKRRCVILADSFYEWNSDKSDKNPYRFMTDTGVFPMAAIWQTIETIDGQKLHTVAIITTESNDLMKVIHHRMPVILSKDNEQIWLNNQIKDIQLLEQVIRPYDSNHMYYEQVSTMVNNPKNDDVSLIRKID